MSSIRSMPRFVQDKGIPLMETLNCRKLFHQIFYTMEQLLDFCHLSMRKAFSVRLANIVCEKFYD